MRSSILFLTLLTAPLFAADITGKWTLDGEVAGNIIKGTCTLKQADSKISGTCKLETKEVADATGEASDEKIVFRHKVEHQGNIYTLQYSGTLSGTALKGDITVPGEGASGYFSATKQ